MSKSLKNFITIKEFCTKFTPRQIRFVFLTNKWWMPMTYSLESMMNAATLENRVFTFLSVLESKLKTNEYLIKNVCFSNVDKAHFKYFNGVRDNVHDAFCDNIDTSLVIKHILDLISFYYANEDSINNHLLYEICVYVKRILNAMGFIGEETKQDDSCTNFVLDVLNDYRNDIRDLCKKKSEFKDFYTASDKVRDKLKEKGYIIEDKGKDSRIRKANLS
ncbi:hypothetical protein EDEG_03840 [Edhazardia aedis USNM 41457]|uniref:tRNA synthetases class I catalytic domain-containing protein n=1 Tax=Edhazardia aedis (strain USNM 41457) TaxID=1003232 RepID=J9DG97_EDHAE|nr:hypothetical protein EDEG_03840 [Edhazardia aedis USNM 41457]|eukprot:EJW01615.1 hypothetical protein EDEG_03840 [Edhazardia aedis USNM 41457]